MRVLMISTDRAMLVPGSAVGERMKEYGRLVDRLEIVLLSDKKHHLKETKLSDKVTVYPTNSFNKFFRPLDAVSLGEKITADLITTQDPFECGWAGLKLKEQKKIPIEVQLHTDPFSVQFNGFLNALRKFIGKGVVREADGIRVVLASVGDKLVERWGVSRQKLITLPIYVDRRRISGEPKFDLHDRYGFKNVVLAVSRLSAEKNIGMLIEAVSTVPNAGLVIVGDGPERNKFKESHRVKFAGWQEDLSSFYKTADVFVQASKFEGYGLSLVEAGLSSLPVITAPVGVANELKNVLIAQTATEFAEKLNSLLADKQETTAKGSALRQELEAEVLTKEAYLTRLRENWEKLTKTP